MKTESQEVQVFHGTRVEIGADWVCEAAWDGCFPSGDFDQTDIVIGSGVRVREWGVIFVSAGNTIDRLHSMELGDRTWVSNSLPCLLAELDADVDPTYRSYYSNFGSIVKGLSKYKREILTSKGPIAVTYFHNLIWDGAWRLRISKKQIPTRDFSSFEDYRDFLSGTMKKVCENAMAAGRLFRYEVVGTISQGYDSVATTVLGRGAGCGKALCFDQSSRGIIENGKAIATNLGLESIVVDREKWREFTNAECLFVASDAKGEDVFFWGAKEVLAGKIVLTGYHGDSVWAKSGKDLSPFLVRGDRSGLSLSEARLRMACLVCPVPFWGATQIREINAISNSSAMSEWDWPATYSRPICRRIVEEAGVPRLLFGTQKTASSVMFLGRSAEHLTLDTNRNFRNWMMRINPLLGWLIFFANGRTSNFLEKVILKVVYKFSQMTKRFPIFGFISSSMSSLFYEIYEQKYFAINRYFFAYAIEYCKEAYKHQQRRGT